MNLEKTRKGIVTVIYLGVFMVLFAVTVSMFSTVLPKLTERYSLTMSQVSTFSIVTNYVATFIGTFLILSIGDRFPKGVTIGIDAVCMGLLLFWIDTLPPYVLLLAVFSVMHLTTMILNNVITAFAADLFQEKRSRYISLMHIFYSIGALFGPKLPEAVEKAGFTWNHSYAFLGLVTIVIAATYFLVLHKNGLLTYKLPAMPKTSSDDEKKTQGEITVGQIIKHPMFLSLCLLQILYLSGHQNLFSNWFQLFLQREYPDTYTASFTATCMTIYWIGMFISRMISMITADKVTPRQFITVGSAIGVLAQVLGIFGNTHVTWIITCLLLGVCTGGIYPLIFAISIAYFPRKSAGITSLIGIMSSFGGILVTWLMGKLADRSLYTAMFLPLTCLALVFILIRWKFKEN